MSGEVADVKQQFDDLPKKDVDGQVLDSILLFDRGLVIVICCSLVL